MTHGLAMRQARRARSGRPSGAPRARALKRASFPRSRVADVPVPFQHTLPAAYAARAGDVANERRATIEGASERDGGVGG